MVGEDGWFEVMSFELIQKKMNGLELNANI